LELYQVLKPQVQVQVFSLQVRVQVHVLSTTAPRVTYEIHWLEVPKCVC